MSIRAVVFDIGGVLEFTPSTGWVERWEKRLNRDLGTVFNELDRIGLNGDLDPSAIISNSFVGAREKEAEAYQFDTICDFIIYSHEVGLRKPDPRIFALA